MPYKGFQKGRSWDIKNNDMAILKNQYPEINLISGVIFGTRGDNNVVKGDKYGSYSIMGYSPDYNKIDIQQIKRGRFVNDLDIQQRRKVCVIGEQVEKDLFGPAADPVCQPITIQGI